MKVGIRIERDDNGECTVAAYIGADRLCWLDGFDSFEAAKKAADDLVDMLEQLGVKWKN